jgi:hypothetical protein
MYKMADGDSISDKNRGFLFAPTSIHFSGIQEYRLFFTKIKSVWKLKVMYQRHLVSLLRGREDISYFPLYAFRASWLDTEIPLWRVRT